jgi:hypothetical protein
MSGSPAVVAMADANAAALNLANIEQRGYQAVSRTEQAAEMTRYKGKVDYNNMMQQAFMGQYNSDIQRASIINQGNMNYYAGASKAYPAHPAANAALVGSIGDAATGYASAGGFSGGGGGSTGTMQGPTGYTPNNYSSGLGNDARQGFAP